MARAYCIPASQRTSHMVWEGLAVFVSAPILLWASTRNRELTKYEKAGLFLIATGSIAIDGVLLAEYTRMK